MSSPNLAVLTALDTARTQWYHVTAIVIAGMGFFTDAYDLFCISTVSKLLGRLYYYDPASGKPGKIPDPVNNFVIGVALVRTLSGQLFFGFLGDKLGRKKVYGVTLVLMILVRFWYWWRLSSICYDHVRICYKRTRGAFIAAVFAMQGVGIIAAGLVSMSLSALFLHMYPTPAFTDDHVLSTQPQADLMWRINCTHVRMRMPETGRYNAIIQGNAKQAAADMGRVLDIEIQADDEKLEQFKSVNNYSLLSREFVSRHGLHLLGTTTTWFLLDIAFYSQNLTQKDIFPAIGLTKEAVDINALQEVFDISKAMFIIAMFGTFPGYWFTVFFIEKIGRFIIQLVGFFMMSVFMLIIGIKYDYLKKGNHKLFAALYGLTFFFANFGPNSITFVLPAELFPTRVRSTCHALRSASGKAGALVGAFGIQSYTLGGNTNKIKKAMMILAFTNMLGFFFTFLVPETKGRSLEEISGEDGDRYRSEDHSTVTETEENKKAKPMGM
ncbi:hypothetical protein MKX03_031160 [Papaver bracteatum]|nr:hypothetical protein MKX03_031160 [Papaver bracteatum]